MDGEIVLSTTVEALALAEMEEAKAARQAPGRELLQRERAALDVAAFVADNYAEKQSRNQGSRHHPAQKQRLGSRPHNEKRGCLVLLRVSVHVG
jgi:hypothetical protein